MAISLDEVKHVASLARLELDEQELLAFQGELNSLMEHFKDISAVDTEGLEPKPHAVSLVNVMSDDVVGTHLRREEALRSSAKTKAGLFIVPTILEDSH
jgi:aspartyl-tRNA(Asn)/glutamyl-tRNA(Gln) amidotransferase subunit C